MTIWISGEAQSAVLEKDHLWVLFSEQLPNDKQEITAEQAQYVKSQWRDVYIREVENEAEARLTLQTAINHYAALLMCSLAMDEEIDLSSRLETAEEAEQFLRDLVVFDFVLSVFCARPMPESADLKTALILCAKHELPYFSRLIEELKALSTGIARVRNAWEESQTLQPENAFQFKLFQAEAIRCGVFLEMSKRGLSVGRHTSEMSLLVELLDEKMRPAFELDNKSNFLASWVTQLVNSQIGEQTQLIPSIAQNNIFSIKYQAPSFPRIKALKSPMPCLRA